MTGALILRGVRQRGKEGRVLGKEGKDRELKDGRTKAGDKDNKTEKIPQGNPG